MDQQDYVKPLKIELFSIEGQRYLREIVSVVDIRNYAKLDAGIPSIESTEFAATDDAALESTDSNGFGYGCVLCGFQCSTVPEQREHFQSEWHVFNLRRRLKSKPTINEEIYEEVLKGSQEVKKSESSSSDTSSDENEAQEEQHTKLEVTSFGTTRGGAVFFLTKENRVVSCYRGLLTPLRSYQVENHALMANLRQLHTGSNIWIILILSGGHFAAAVFENTNLKSNEAVVHKTIHRYTVRAKQGGSQSTKDAQQGKAKSAGASLRRFNEEALCKDIRNLVTDWSEYVRRASAIFLRCAIYKRHIFFAGDEPLFSKTDQRIRNIPFVTRRPTYEELKRVRSELATLDVYESYESFLQVYRNETVGKSDLEEEMKRISQLRLEKKLKSPPKRNATKKNSPSRREGGSPPVDSLDAPKKSAAKKGSDNQRQEFHLPQELRQRLYTTCKRGDATAMRQVVEERPDEARAIRDYLNSPVNDKESSRFLHLASASGHSDLVRFLLDFGCDPTKRNADNRVPFQVANGRSTRNAFARFREDYPTRWDWNAAQIPEPVDPEVEATRKAKVAERKKVAAKAKAEKLKEQKEADAKARAEEEEKRRYLQLSDREKRALAAERRWKTQMLAGGGNEDEKTPRAVLSRCFRCGIDITGKVPFEYSENRFCTVKCVKEHRAANC